MESDLVYLVDCDPEALEMARENVFECEGIVELINAKVKYDSPSRKNNIHGRGGGRGHRGGRGGRGKRGGKGRGTNMASSAPANSTLYSDPNNNDADDGIPLSSKIVDTVITNPPFGTKNNEGIDVQFLKTAIRLARRTVYSFHKTSTRPFLLKLLREKWGLDAEVVAEMKFPISKMYKFHNQKCVDVEVDLLRVSLDGNRESAEKLDDETTANNNSPVIRGKHEEEGESEGEEMPLGLCGHA